MQKSPLKVGVDKPVKFNVVVQIDEADNMTDVFKLSKIEAPDNVSAIEGAGAEYLVGRFMRGHRITLQQDSGARELVADMIRNKKSSELTDPAFVKKVTTAVQTCVDQFDVTSERARGGRPPKVVTLDENTVKAFMKKGDVQGLQDYLNSFALRVELTVEK